MRQFVLTEEHLMLLENAYVGWQDCETGAPEIDPKRPYGNSSVWRDVAELLGKPLPEDGNESASAQEMERETREECERLHRETETALEIVLSTRSFAPGRYELATENGHDARWRLKAPLATNGAEGEVDPPRPVPCEAFDTSKAEDVPPVSFSTDRCQRTPGCIGVDKHVEHCVVP